MTAAPRGEAAPDGNPEHEDLIRLAAAAGSQGRSGPAPLPQRRLSGPPTLDDLIALAARAGEEEQRRLASDREARAVLRGDGR